MRNILLAVAAIVSTTAPATAQDRFLFGGTDSTLPALTTPGTITLTFDGITSFIATDSGWITSSGRHDMSNQNYLTGSFNQTQYNSYASFALGALAPVSPYTSATITYASGNSRGSGPFQLSLFDVGTDILSLDMTRTSGDATGQAIFNDLGSGVLFGSASLPGPYVLGQSITVSLNQNFLNQVNAGTLQTFAIGATLAPITTPAPAVPEPATWGMMMLGIGLIGTALRRRPRVALA